MEITYISYQHIDKEKWDSCIQMSANGIVYANSRYLDCMCSHWDALIMGDYEAVMALTWRRKYGIYYLYQPPFTAALGVFGNNIDAVLIEKFLAAIPQKFRYWDINLNHSNLVPLNRFTLTERVNYFLPLHQSYETIYAAYRDNTKRNIQKAIKLGCTVKKNIPVNQVLALAKEQALSFSTLTNSDFENFEALYVFFNAHEQAVTYGVFSERNELLASSAFIYYKKRAYYIVVGNHPNGKTIGASHMLINAFIKDHAGNDLVLDFEGSDIRSLAFFYSSFGAQIEKYGALKYNRLPAVLKLLKK